MLTLFAIPKPFEGHIGTIQRNALASWVRLKPQPEIILLGRDAGVAEAAREFSVRHEPHIACNEFGTPLVSDAFMQVQNRAIHPLVMFSNADMLYDQSLLAAAGALAHHERFLLSGRRWDMDIAEDLTSTDDSSWQQLFAGHAARGKLHGPSGMDYFVFPRSMPLDMPSLAVGRAGWDAWLVWKCRMAGIPVIDATRTIIALHQNHGYASLRLGYQHWRGPERDLNVQAAGGLAHMLTLREASYELIAGKLVPPTGWRVLSTRFATWRAYRWSLVGKRWMQRQFHR